MNKGRMIKFTKRFDAVEPVCAKKRPSLIGIISLIDEDDKELHAITMDFRGFEVLRYNFDNIAHINIVCYDSKEYNE